LLDAAADCIQRFGLEKTGIADIAGEAGVTRRTVYRYFSDRDSIVSATLVRGVSEFANRARELIAATPDPAQAVLEGLLFALRELPRDPLLGSLMVAGEVALSDAEFPEAMRVLEFVLEPLREAAQWSEHEFEEAGELIIRLALSLMASPRAHRSEPELREFLRVRLLPGLGLESR
jgi:AcrR family transcriptional regulator